MTDPALPPDRSPLAHLAVLLVLCLLLTACAAGPTSRWAPAEVPPAGFFAGIWHGMIVVFALVVSFFADGVGIYEIHNTGFAYDLGFVLGAMGTFGGGIHVTRRKSVD